MSGVREIHRALMRLACIGRAQFAFDPGGQVFGDGEIHYLLEVSGMYFLAWKDSDTKVMMINPITRFDLDELEELGADEAWTVLNVPASLEEGIQFRKIDSAELVGMYRRMQKISTERVYFSPGEPFSQAAVAGSLADIAGNKSANSEICLAFCEVSS